MENVKSSNIEDLAKFAKDGKIIIEVLEGQARKFLEPVKPIEKVSLSLDGTINTVYEFLKKRSGLFEPKNCQIAISVDNFSMQFIGNDQRANNDHKTLITGQINKTKELKEIPFGEDFRPKDLGRVLRMRKHLFEDIEQFKKLFAELNSFKAAIDKKVEETDDKKGNYVSSIKQDVIHNLSNVFTLKMPILKGGAALTFEVEIDIDAESLDCILIAPDLPSLIQEQANAMISAELEKEIGFDKTKVKMKDFCFVYSY